MKPKLIKKIRLFHPHDYYLLCKTIIDLRKEVAKLETVVKEKDALLVDVGRGLIGAYKALYGG